jgi:ribonuclease D
MSAFSDPRWFDREAAVERAEVLCRAVPQADGAYIRQVETQSGAPLHIVTFRICEGSLSGRHAGLLIWPPRSAADRERALGPLATTPDELLPARLAETTLRCRVETSPFGELEVRKLIEVAPETPVPEPAGPHPPLVREDLLPAQPPEAPATRIVVLRTPEQVQEAVAQLADQPVLGFDIETACTRLPPERREERDAFDPWNGTVRLVQIAAPSPTGDFVSLVVDCWEVDPAPLLRLLGDGRRVLAHNAKFEQSWITYRWGIELTDLFDTCAWWTVIAGHLNAAGFEHGVEDAKLVTLAERFLHAELDKSFQTSDWAQEELSDGQLEYAGVDASILLPLAELLEELGEELDCAEQARQASRAGGRRAAIATHYAAGRHEDERTEALAMIESAESVADLAAAGAIMRRMVLSAASRAAVADAYKARRSSLAA